MHASVEPLAEIERLVELAADAEREGQRMVAQLISEWKEGVNRFDRPGECLYSAVIDGRLVGVCGLNRDPFVTEPDVGRVRRLYVAGDFRRRGVASALVARVLIDARASFQTLHVRTYDSMARAFYGSQGFAEVEGDAYYTHERRLVADSPQHPSAAR
jgi:GNAT superfamily N-acetyltransferase